MPSLCSRLHFFFVPLIGLSFFDCTQKKLCSAEPHRSLPLLRRSTGGLAAVSDALTWREMESNFDLQASRRL
jgi:hypothetical protein